jgi:hypothetical protein
MRPKRNGSRTTSPRISDLTSLTARRFKDTEKLVKSKYRHTQEKRIISALYRQPKTMLMVAHETGIERANICRIIARLKKSKRVHLVKFGLCNVSKHKAGYYTTNPDLITAIYQPSKNWQQ